MQAARFLTTEMGVYRSIKGGSHVDIAGNTDVNSCLAYK